MDCKNLCAQRRGFLTQMTGVQRALASAHHLAPKERLLQLPSRVVGVKERLLQLPSFYK